MFGLRLPLRLALWQQMIIWSSVLFSSAAWSTPKAIAQPISDTPARSITTQGSTTARSPSLRQFVPRSDPFQASRSARLQAQRYPAAALLPLQPVQGVVAKTTETIAFSPFEPTVAVAIEAVLAEAIGQANSPPPSDGKPPAAVVSDPTISDPELGVLHLQASPTLPAVSDDLGQQKQQIRCASGAALDPELGCLPLQPLPPPPPPRQPFVYLLARTDYFRSSNVFSAVDPVNDGLIRPGLTLFAAPAIGRNTYLIGSIDGNLVRYNTQSQIDYNDLRFRAGIFQRLSPTMFGELGWSNQQLFIAGGKIPGLPVGTRFLNDHAIRLELSRRDQLNKRLALNTFYQLRLSFADPDSRSRLLNSFIASLSYDVQSNLQVGLDYQFALANFTVIQRDDKYHQVAARLTYTAFRNTQLNVFVGYSFGSSTDPTIEFNSLILGVSLTVSLGLF